LHSSIASRVDSHTIFAPAPIERELFPLETTRGSLEKSKTF
jgi:hypothetical protein